MSNLDRKIWRNYDWLHEHYHTKGLSYASIAQLVGVSKRAVIMACQKVGVTPRSISEALANPKPPIEQLYKLYGSGLSQSQIAARYRVSQPVVCKWMHNYGLEARKPHEAIQVRQEHGKKPLREWANIEWLSNQYESKSVSEIADAVGWSTTFVHDLMAELRIPFRTNSEALSKLSGRISQRMRERWQDPVYRKHMAIRMRSLVPRRGPVAEAKIP